MGPPVYADLGKQSRDVFNKGYHFGVAKLECKTKTSGGVEFTAGVNGNTDTGKVFGNLETKYKIKDYGASLTEKWNTDNLLVTEVSIQDPIVKGLKISFDTNFAPHTGQKSGKLKTEYKHEKAALNCDIDLPAGGPVVHASGVLGYNGWLVGYQTSFETASSKIVKNNFALGYATKEFVMHSNVNDGQEYGGAIYQRVNDQLETGINLSWSAGSNATRFGIGCKYILSKEASVRAKVNNSSQVGLSYQQQLQDGITVTMSALLDGRNFNQGGHKVGIALDLEA